MRNSIKRALRSGLNFQKPILGCYFRIGAAVFACELVIRNETAVRGIQGRVAHVVGRTLGPTLALKREHGRMRRSKAVDDPCHFRVSHHSAVCELSLSNFDAPQTYKAVEQRLVTSELVAAARIGHRAPLENKSLGSQGEREFRVLLDNDYHHLF